MEWSPKAIGNAFLKQNRTFPIDMLQIQIHENKVQHALFSNWIWIFEVFINKKVIPFNYESICLFLIKFATYLDGSWWETKEISIVISLIKNKQLPNGLFFFANYELVITKGAFIHQEKGFSAILNDLRNVIT